MGLLLDVNADTLAVSALCADIMSAVSNGDFDLAYSTVLAAEVTTNGRYQFAPTVALPGFMLVWGPDFVVAAIQGCSDLNHGIETMRGYGNTVGLPLGTGAANSYGISIAEVIRAKMNDQGIYNRKRHVYIGHSLGGLVANVLSLKCFQDGPNREPSYTTFGQPKPGNVEYQQAARLIPGLRWMNQADPVPYIMPSLEEAPFLLTNSTPAQITGYGRLVQWGGGLQIDTDGNYVPAILPDTTLGEWITSLASWLFDRDTSTSGQHRMVAYVRNIYRAYGNSHNPTTVITNRGAPESADPTDRRSINREEQRVVTTVANTQAAQNAAVLIVPPNRLFRVVRTGRLFVIYFGDTPVGMSGNKKTARSLCRQLNVAFRHLQTTAYVDTNGFTREIANYFAAAATVGGDFSPAMSVNLPM